MPYLRYLVSPEGARRPRAWLRRAGCQARHWHSGRAGRVPMPSQQLDRSVLRRRGQRRAQVLTGHVVKSSGSLEHRLETPPLSPGRHTVAGHATVLPDLDGFPALDNAAATAAAITLPNRGPLRLIDGRPDPAILEAYYKYGFYVLEGTDQPIVRRPSDSNC